MKGQGFECKVKMWVDDCETFYFRINFKILGDEFEIWSQRKDFRMKSKIEDKSVRFEVSIFC